VELRGLLHANQAERVWRDALGAIITGFAAVSVPAAATQVPRS